MICHRTAQTSQERHWFKKILVRRGKAPGESLLASTTEVDIKYCLKSKTSWHKGNAFRHVFYYLFPSGCMSAITPSQKTPLVWRYPYR